MNAREIANRIAEILESERETYLELLENEEYEELEDQIFHDLIEE